MTAMEDQARALFLAALEHEPEKWPAILAESCRDNANLRARVEQLLHAHVLMGNIHGDKAAPTIDQPITERTGTIIGPYKLLEEIGEGGFGVVFMAEQHEPIRRKVALKVIKPGMDTRQVIARFEAERQALALMDHPNIAKVLDAGETSSGRPYFVMELVRGVPITQYCDEARLTPNQRLQLFADVCQAVQHAHQKGIIHRDIKPSNVLVATSDGKPLVKVIDFGIAKATGLQLTDKTVFTHFAQMIGTPLYISPEQAGGNVGDVDTRSDIYSLGVLLYELITGTTPFDKHRLKEAAFDEIRRIIREEEPPSPSTRLSTIDELPSVAALRGLEPKKLSALIRGELDWIIMRCLEKDRNRRYDSATGLATELLHFLANEPVQAHPPSSFYRLRKFVRRNKGAVLAASLVIAALVLGAGGSAWQAVRATRAGDRAKNAEQAANDRATAERIARERAERAEDKLERALARTVTAPLSLRNSAFLSEPECRSLWALAGSDSARLKLRFLEEAVATELDVRQLLTRSNYALAAALGLNSGLRRQAEENLLAAMKDESTSLRVRTAIACIILDLAQDGPTTAQAGVTVIARGLSAEQDDDLRKLIYDRLLASSDRLEPAHVLPVFVQALEKETDRLGREKLAQGLATVASHMPPADAVPLLLKILERESAARVREELAQGLAAIVGYMPPADAARVCSNAAGVLMQALEKEPASWIRQELAQGLAAIVGHMSPTDAARVCSNAAGVLMQALEKEPEPLSRLLLAQRLTAMVGHMPPADAARVCANTARLLALAVANSSNPFDRVILAQGLATIAGEMSPPDAARLLMQALEKETAAHVCQKLAQGLAAVAGRLPPADAAHICSDAARLLGRALERISNAFESQFLVDALVTVARRMPPADAVSVCTDAARRLGQALEKSSNAVDRQWLAIGLADLAGQMPPAEAARLLTRALERESDASVRLYLAEGLVAQAKHRDRTEEASWLASAIRVLKGNWNKGSRQLGILLTLSAIAQRADNTAASHASLEIARRIPDATQFDERAGNPALVMEQCLEFASQPVFRQRATAIAASIGNLASNTWPGVCLASAACEPLPCRLETRDLVELLKIPTYSSDVRRVILDQLGNRYHQRFARHWDFVRYAEEHNLNLDFTSPAQRPDPKLPQLFDN